MSTDAILLELWKSLLTLAVMGVIAYTSGYFGVRRGLEQARKQRGFDLSVKWHESVIGATNELRYLSREFWIHVECGETIKQKPVVGL
jgi:hypothetical protein